MTAEDSPALHHLNQLGLAHRVVRHGPVDSLAEAAAIRGIETRDLVKTLVVRESDESYYFVLVPSNKKFSWPKLRAVLAKHRLSMPDAATAYEVTGYVRGTITPFGSRHPWPVIADQSITGRQISLGSGIANTGIILDADDAIAALAAQVADITDEHTGR